MPLTVSTGLIVLGVIALVAIVGYWIDEAEEALEHDAHAPSEGQRPG